MKHEEISLKTKQMFSEQLKIALKKKPLQKITVTELINACGVNRKTFYYHFEDIYALLKWTFEQEAIEVVKHFDLMVDYEEAITFTLDYVEENEYIMNCVYDSIGREELKRFFYADFFEIVISIIDRAEEMAGKSLDAGYKEFLCNFYMEALAGMLINWIKEKGKGGDRAATIYYISTTIRKSLIGILDSI